MAACEQLNRACKSIEYDPKDAINKKYRIRTTGREGSALETTIPRDIVEREARRHNMSIDEFIEKFEVNWNYDSFDGAHFTFKERE